MPKRAHPSYCPACRGTGNQITETNYRACQSCGGSGWLADYLHRAGPTAPPPATQEKP